MNDLFSKMFDTFPYAQVITCIILTILILIFLAVIVTLLARKNIAKKFALDGVTDSLVTYIGIDDEDDLEDEEDVSNDLIEEVESSIINLNDASIEENKLTTPRRMNLALRLNNSTNALKGRYSILRNYLEGYKIHHNFLKHRDLYYLVNKVSETNENGGTISKKQMQKVAMITIRRKQLILSLNMDLDLIKDKETLLSNNMVIEERRYEGYNLNLTVSSQYCLNKVIDIISILFDSLNIKTKKHHKDVDYVKMFSEDLSTFESRGFGYLVRNQISFEEADQYKDSLSIKAIVINKLEERVPSNINEFTISLDEIASKFSNHAKVNLDVLKQNKLAPKNANKLIVTDGTSLDKKLFVDADSFASNAIKMIFLTGGEARINRRIAC